MKFLQLLFALIAQFVPNLEDGKINELQGKAFLWWNPKAGNPDQKIPHEDSAIGRILKYDNEWYVQTFFAILYLPLKKAIAEWYLTPSVNDEDENQPEALYKIINGQMVKIN